MKQRIVLILIFCGFMFSAFAERGYYVKNKQINSGVQLINDESTNSNYCQMQTDKGIVRMSPSEIEEYGFQNGTTFESFYLNDGNKTKGFFLKRLVKGKIGLYCINVADGSKKYFIKTKVSAELIELPKQKQALEAVLAEYLNDSPQYLEDIKLVINNEKNLIRLLSAYNSGVIMPLQRLRLGLKLGMDATNLSVVDDNSIYSYGQYASDWNMSVGLFLDVPILGSNWTVAPELLYKSFQINQKLELLKESYDLDLTYSTLNIPVLFKYNFEKENCIPYLLMGPQYSRALKNASLLNKYEKGFNKLLSSDTSPIMPQNMGGYAVGCGLSFPAGKKLSFFGECRFSKLYSFDNTVKTLNPGDFSFILGFLF